MFWINEQVLVLLAMSDNEWDGDDYYNDLDNPYGDDGIELHGSSAADERYSNSPEPEDSPEYKEHKEKSRKVIPIFDILDDITSPFPEVVDDMVLFLTACTEKQLASSFFKTQVDEWDSALYSGLWDTRESIAIRSRMKAWECLIPYVINHPEASAEDIRNIKQKAVDIVQAESQKLSAAMEREGQQEQESARLKRRREQQRENRKKKLRLDDTLQAAASNGGLREQQREDGKKRQRSDDTILAAVGRK